MVRRLTAALLLSGIFFARAVDAQPIVVVIGGNHSDPSPAQLQDRTGRGGNSGLWRMKGDLSDEDELEAEYFNWNGTRAGKIDQASPPGAEAIAELIRNQRAERPEASVVLVGNSWGGHTAWQVCRLLNGQTIAQENGGQSSFDSSTLRREASEGRPPRTSEVESSVPAKAENASRRESPGAANITPPQSLNDQRSGVVPVELVVFLDPSSFGRTSEANPSRLPQNVRAAVNYFTRNSFSWNAWPDELRVRNVDLGDPENGFVYPGGPKYDSILNWRAHVSAEWDEKIHVGIRRQIRSAVGRVTEAGGKVP